MADLLEEIESKYEKLKKDLDLHKVQQASYENEAFNKASIRDELNKKTKDLFREAKEYREQRDILNDKVKQLKAEREEWREKLQKSYDELKEIKKKISNRAGEGNITQFRKRIKDLEHKQETTVLTSDKERALVEEIHALHAQIERMKKEEEEAMKKNQEYMQKKADISVAKMKLDAIQSQLEEAVTKSQEFHDKSIELFEKASESKRESDEAHQSFINFSQKEREEEKAIHNIIEELRDFEKIITGLRQKQRNTKKQERESELKKTADAIFEKFKKGEPLSTEDILILQKAGFM